MSVAALGVPGDVRSPLTTHLQKPVSESRPDWDRYASWLSR